MEIGIKKLPNYEIERISKLVDDNAYISMEWNHNKSDMGRIVGIGEDKKHIILEDYLVNEPILVSGKRLDRFRIENEKKPIPLQDYNIFKIGYEAMKEFILTNNFESYSKINNPQLQRELFKRYPLPTGNLRKFLEENNKD